MLEGRYESWKGLAIPRYSGRLMDELVVDLVAILRDGELVLVERLDALKAAMREITVTLAGDGTAEAADLPELPAEVIVRRCRSRQVRMLVRAREAPERIEAVLAAHPAVADVEVRAPSLEEIFIAHMERRAPEGSAAGDREATP